MSEKKEVRLVDRRNVFRKAGLGAGALGVAAVGLFASKAKAESAKSPPKRAGYRETEHVKKYYELARF